MDSSQALYSIFMRDYKERLSMELSRKFGEKMTDMVNDVVSTVSDIMKGDYKKRKRKRKRKRNKVNKKEKDLKQIEEYMNKYYPDLKEDHVQNCLCSIYMSSFIYNIDTSDITNILKKGIIDFDKYVSSKEGNIYKFVDQKYVKFCKYLTNTRFGGNGGNASKGKGEWMLSLCSGIDENIDKPKIQIKNNNKKDKGGGDLFYYGINEEVKWNGGRISVDNKRGNEIEKEFSKKTGLKAWVPFRKKDKDIEDKFKNNALYLNCIINSSYQELTDNELKEIFMIKALKIQFVKIQSFVVFDNEGNFIRFTSSEDSINYYKNKINDCKFEVRANQNNPVSMYCLI